MNGGQPAAVMTHGFPGTPSEMRPLAQALHDQGWTTRGILLPGLGPEIEQATERSHSDWLNAVKSAQAELQQQGHRPVILIGNSTGAALSLQVAAEKAVDALILFAPFNRLADSNIRLAWPLIRLMKQVKPFRVIPLDFENEEVREGIHNFFPDANLDDPEVQEGIRNAPIPLRVIDQVVTAGRKGFQAASQVRVPMVIFQGVHDPVALPADTDRLIARLPQAPRLVKLEGEHNLLDPTLPF
ncbi:MAG: alpha/beta fold hydrolase [Chloroflexi bacterium]|nr:alpha/beta fold hydrolase [Chloroflexota bacterium]